MLRWRCCIGFIPRELSWTRSQVDRTRAAYLLGVEDGFTQPFHVLVGGEFVQINSVAAADADVGRMTLDRVRLFQNHHIKSGISLMKGVS